MVPVLSEDHVQDFILRGWLLGVILEEQEAHQLQHQQMQWVWERGLGTFLVPLGALGPSSWLLEASSLDWLHGAAALVAGGGGRGGTLRARWGAGNGCFHISQLQLLQGAQEQDRGGGGGKQGEGGKLCGLRLLFLLLHLLLLRLFLLLSLNELSHHWALSLPWVLKVGLTLLMELAHPRHDWDQTTDRSEAGGQMGTPGLWERGV